jgi:TPR repeat protein
MGGFKSKRLSWCDVFKRPKGFRNELEAANCYRPSADQGDAAAQYYLGLRCENGVGIAKNDSEAAL